MIRYFQFSLKTLLWLMTVVAAFCVGIAVGRRLEQSQSQAALKGPDGHFIDYPEYPDSRLWQRGRTSSQAEATGARTKAAP